MKEQIMKAIYKVWNNDSDWFIKEGENLGLTMEACERSHREVTLGITPVMVIGREENIRALCSLIRPETHKIYVNYYGVYEGKGKEL